jgi:hypothetical protein
MQHFKSYIIVPSVIITASTQKIQSNLQLALSVKLTSYGISDSENMVRITPKNMSPLKAIVIPAAKQTKNTKCNISTPIL